MLANAIKERLYFQKPPNSQNISWKFLVLSKYLIIWPDCLRNQHGDDESQAAQKTWAMAHRFLVWSCLANYFGYIAHAGIFRSYKNSMGCWQFFHFFHLICRHRCCSVWRNKSRTARTCRFRLRRPSKTKSSRPSASRPTPLTRRRPRRRRRRRRHRSSRSTLAPSSHRPAASCSAENHLSWKWVPIALEPIETSQFCPVFNWSNSQIGNEIQLSHWR